MHKDVNIKQYQSLIDQHESLQQKLSAYSVTKDKTIAVSILAGAEELLYRWDETGTDYSTSIEALLEKVESFFKNKEQ